MRSLLFLPLIFLATTSISSPPDPHAAIRAAPVLLDPADPGRTRVGALHYLGGWELTSERPDFGGISGLHVRDGEVLAISDAGAVFRFRIGRDGAVSGARFSLLPAGPGAGQAKKDRDSESLAIDPETGSAWVGFERHNAVWRYASDLGAAEAHSAPSAMADWPWNSGPEAMARLADGRFLIVCEEPKGPGNTHQALLFAGDPTRSGEAPIRFLYRAPPGFWVTDAAQLPDGRLLLLHRDFAVARGVSAALALVDPAEIREGAVIPGRLIARFAAPLTLDNMEALAIERSGARTILWLASDDNFSPLQRTLLMKFELVE